ncbi:MAG: D-glycerate dehydrogenase [Firmicutes bacterium]|nr:D-glycerate dehydrogenase [Candidatus Fermentithermobacillaceae bacterium]
MTRPKVYVTRKIPEPAIALLRESLDVSVWPEEDVVVPRDVLMREVKEVEGLLCVLTEKVDRELLDAAPRLKIVANMAVGYDNIDVGSCTERGIVVTNTPDVLTDATADLAFALLLATARRLPEAMDFLLKGQWKTWSPMLLTGKEVYGATLGIVGMGRIGQAVAKRARGFDMKVLYYSKRRNPQVEEEIGARYVDKETLLRESDYVSLHLPLTPETRGFIGERELRMMKPTAVLINTARGAVVDERALYKALREGWIWAAGLDVFEVEPLPMDSPLRTLPNVVLLPHIGSATVKTRTEMALLAARNIRDYLVTGRVHTPVNPEALGENLR